MTGTPTTKRKFRVFLSHSYEAPAENLYFWSVLSGVSNCEFSFSVDPGIMPDGRKKPTSVTRLEQLIRDSDAVVGVFSLPKSRLLGASSVDPDAHAYFRLETDLAIRARKPTLLFIDERLDKVFLSLHGCHVETFNAQEVRAQDHGAKHEQFMRTARAFCDEIEAYKSYVLSRREKVDRHAAAIIVGGQDSKNPYLPSILGMIQDKLSDRGFLEPRVLRFPDRRRPFQLEGLDKYTLTVVDVGSTLFRTGLVGYLHGRLVPMIRMLHLSGSTGGIIGEQRVLHAGIEKGYDKDRVEWSKVEELATKLDERLSVIELESELITDAASAASYFQRAAKRKEAVFLSYTAEDAEIASALYVALSKQFQSVFDYKQPGAMVAGQPWPAQIGAVIARSEVAIKLISEDYFESDQCKKEWNMIEARSSAEIVAISVKLYDRELKNSPLNEQKDQYIRRWQYALPELLVAEIIRSIDERRAKQAPANLPPPQRDVTALADAAKKS